jgi:hypothetical protein
MLGSRGPYSLNKPLLILYFAAWALYLLRLVPLGVALIPFGFVFALCTYLVFQRRKGRVALLAMDALFSAVCIVVWRMVGVGSYIPVRATGLAVVALGVVVWLLALPYLRRRRPKTEHI